MALSVSGAAPSGSSSPPASGDRVSLLDALLAVAFAPTCGACGLPLSRPTAGAVCAGCWSGILPLQGPLCASCGDPLPDWRVHTVPLGRCARCRRSGRVITRGRAIGAYDGPLRAIIHALKYDGRRTLAPRLAALMRERGSDVLQDADAVVPVPLHRARERQRGFNQAADLARCLDRPVVAALRRVRPTAVQASLPAARRHANVRDAFAVTALAARLAGSVVVVIDDVSTTGATLDACARVLVEAGIREVRALTAARVVTTRR